MRVILSGVAVAAAVAALFLWRPGFVAQADSRACDFAIAMAGPGRLSGHVAIVEIDENALARYGRWPWPRDLVASAIQRILDHGASVVALDTILNTVDRSAPTFHPAAGETNDEVLAEVERGGPVVLGYAFRFDRTAADAGTCAMQPLPLAIFGPGEASRSGFFHPSGALCNVTALARAAADNGFLNASVDLDGKVRRLPLVMESGDRQYPGFALAAFRTYLHVTARDAGAVQLFLNAGEALRLRVGSRVVPLDGPSSMGLRFRGPGRAFPYFPVADVMDGRIPADALKDRIVVFGGSAIGLPNPVATPVDPHFPDVEVQATAIDNLIQGDSIQRSAAAMFWEVVFSLACSVGCTFLFAGTRAWWGFWIPAGAIAGGWTAAVVLLNATGMLFSPLPLTAMLICEIPVVTLLRSTQDNRRASLAERQFAIERERAQKELRSSEARYRQLVENISDAIVVEDTEGHLQFANRRFREWFGWGTTEPGEATLDEYIAPEYRAVAEKCRRELSAGRAPDSVRFEALCPDGRRIWIEALAAGVSEGTKTIGTQWALRDVTERKRLEEQFLQAQKMESVGRLAGGIAHDFNNLLTVINGYSDMLLDPEGSGIRLNDGLTAIRAAGERAAELTGNLLAFSRKQTVRLAVVDLNEIVQTVQDMFGLLLGEDIELAIRRMPSPARIIADEGQLQQVLTNLLVNARDAMPAGGRIEIETTNVAIDGALWVQLNVKDNGTGMTDEVRRHIFEPFFTTKEPGKGTGLGLATVYGIVQQCSGRIEVESRPGEGTTFRLFFPYGGEEQAVGSGAAKAAQTKPGRGNVLVVEDQDAVREFMCKVLRVAGYGVMEAPGGGEALALAQSFQGKIDLVLTDLIMPGINGRELAVRLQESRPGIRVVFTSGYSEEAIGDRGIVAAGLRFLAKPFTPEKLLAAVREAMGERATGESNGPISAAAGS